MFNIRHLEKSNDLTLIEADAFSGLTHISQLYLRQQWNLKHILKENSFHLNIENVQVDLKCNSIETIEGGTFNSGTSTWAMLNIRFNNQQSMTCEAFDDVKVKALILCFNPFICLPECLLRNQHDTLEMVAFKGLKDTLKCRPNLSFMMNEKWGNVKYSDYALARKPLGPSVCQTSYQ